MAALSLPSSSLLLPVGAATGNPPARQVCVAPDYVLAHRSVAEPLARAIAATWREWFGEDEAGWRAANGIPRMVSQERWRAAAAMLEEAHGGTVLCGGLTHALQSERYMPPTVVLGPSESSQLLRDEIFAPLLPVLAVDSIDAAAARIGADERPLALYVFTSAPEVGPP